MSDDVFNPAGGDLGDDAAMAQAAIDCVSSFSARFNARDLAGMDAHLHFPHIILSGENLVIWERPAQLPATFFDDLIATTGWDRSVYQQRQPVLISPHKVHLLVEYTRNRRDGSVISRPRTSGSSPIRMVAGVSSCARTEKTQHDALASVPTFGR